MKYGLFKLLEPNIWLIMREIKNLSFISTIMMCLFVFSLFSQEWDCPELCNEDTECCEEPFPRAHKFYIGPEFYHLRRTREGGTWQRGQIYGVRIGYDRIKRCRLYWGADALYGQGRINGRSGTNDKLTSTFTDEQVEGRFGYTLQSKKGARPSFTPFIGFGYQQEINDFRSPSPLKLKFRTYYYYFLTGFLTSIDISPHLSVGTNFKVRFMQEPKCRVSDPDLDDITQQIKERVCYRVEVPISYRFCSFTDHLELDLVPFYELRHYGGLENFPFDFFETKLRFYGISIQFSYRL